MRRVLPLSLLALAACSSEPDFDERFEKAETETRQLAEEIDSELAQAEAAKAPADADVGEEEQ